MKVRIGTAELEYEEAGKGDPLVLVHGSLQTLRSFGRLMEPLSGSYRVLAYTRRHHPGSEDELMERPLTPSAAADDLIDLIETLGLAPAYVMAHSYGAVATLGAALKRPDCFRALALSEPPLGYLLQTDPDWQDAWNDFIANVYDAGQRSIRAGDIESGIAGFVNAIMGEGFFGTLPPPIQAAMLTTAPAFAIEEAPGVAFTQEDAGRLTLPVLLITGEQSPAWLRRIIGRLRELLPQAEQVDIPNTGHATYANIEAFTDSVLGFFARN